MSDNETTPSNLIIFGGDFDHFLGGLIESDSEEEKYSKKKYKNKKHIKFPQSEQNDFKVNKFLQSNNLEDIESNDLVDADSDNESDDSFKSESSTSSSDLEENNAKNEEVLTEDGKILAEDEEVLTEDEKMLAEDEEVLTEDEKILAEDEEVLTEDEKILAEDEEVLMEDEKILAEDKEKLDRNGKIAIQVATDHIDNSLTPLDTEIINRKHEIETLSNTSDNDEDYQTTGGKEKKKRNKRKDNEPDVLVEEKMLAEDFLFNEPQESQQEPARVEPEHNNGVTLSTEPARVEPEHEEPEHEELEDFLFNEPQETSIAEQKHEEMGDTLVNTPKEEKKIVDDFGVVEHDSKKKVEQRPDNISADITATGGNFGDSIIATLKDL